MGMTIAEPIQTLEYLKDSGVFPFSTKEGVLYTVESIDVAIETMRKYEKIEKIIRNYDVAWEFHTLRGTVDKIKEVIEDGNDDCK